MGSASSVTKDGSGPCVTDSPHREEKDDDVLERPTGVCASAREEKDKEPFDLQDSREVDDKVEEEKEGCSVAMERPSAVVMDFSSMFQPKKGVRRPPRRPKKKKAAKKSKAKKKKNKNKDTDGDEEKSVDPRDLVPQCGKKGCPCAEFCATPFLPNACWCTHSRAAHRPATASDKARAAKLVRIRQRKEERKWAMPPTGVCVCV